MNEKMPWIKSRLFITILVTAIIISKNVEAARKPGVKAVILYTHDESAVGSSVVTMQVDQETFMNVIKNSQTRFLDAKPLRFIQDNGFFDLLEGDSTAFSFATSSGMADCDCKCSRKATTTTTTTTTTTPKPIIITTSRPITTPRIDPCGGRGSGPYCCANGALNPDCCENRGGSGPFCCTNGVTNNKFCCANGAQNPTCSIATTPTPTRRTSTPAPTYLPPTTLPPHRDDPCPSGGSGPYCCKNGASNPDCCANGGSGPYCCGNGSKSKDCCANNGSGPYCCENGSKNQDCCLNNGKGKYCCTNGYDNPTCSQAITVTRAPIITTATTKTTSRARVTPPIFISKKPVFQGPSYLPVAKVTTERPLTSTQTYTYGTRPSFKHSFSFTNAYWSYQPHATRNYTTRAPSTTAKYEYQAPINGINYNGADDNSLF